MASEGKVSIDVVADFTRFAAQFQRELNSALSGVQLNTSHITSQVSSAIRQGLSGNLAGGSVNIGSAAAAITREISKAVIAGFRLGSSSAQINITSHLAGITSRISQAVVNGFNRGAAGARINPSSQAGQISRQIASSIQEGINRGSQGARFNISAQLAQMRQQIADAVREGINRGTQGARFNFGPQLAQLTQQTSNAIREGVDRGSHGARFNLQSQMDQIASQIAEAIRTGIRRGGSQPIAIRADAGSISGIGAQLTSLSTQLTSALTVPLTGLGGVTLKVAGDFEAMMNRVKAVTEASTEEFTAMREEAVMLGATTKFSATEAATAMEMLATAGFNTTQIMESMPGVLDMAAAGSVSLADAAQIASGIMNGFGIKAKDLGTVNDMLARTFLSTATTLQDLGYSFKYAGPTAKAVGLTFAETAAAIGLLGNAGIRGMSAGTALNGAMSRLIKPTEEVQDVLNKLNITATSSPGRLRPLVDIFKQLEKSGATAADMVALFGLEAGPDMMALLGQGSVALSDLTKQIENSGGTAEKVAKVQMEGLNGTMEELSSSAEALMIAIGDAGLLAWLTRLAERAVELVNALTALSPKMLNIATVSGIVLAALGPVVFILAQLITAFGVVINAIKRFWTLIKGTTGIMAVLTSWIFWVVVAIVALVVILVECYRKFEGFRNVANSAFRAVADAAIVLWGWLKVAFFGIVAALKVVWTEMVRVWNAVVPLIIRAAIAVWGAWNSIFKPALAAIWGTMGQLARELAGLYRTTIQPVVSAIIGWYAKLASAVVSWWRNNGDTVTRNAGNTISWLWNNIILPGAAAVMAAYKTLAVVVLWAFKTVIIPGVKLVAAVINQFRLTVVAMYNATKPIWSMLAKAVVFEFGNIIAVARWLFNVMSIVWPAVMRIIVAYWGYAQPVFKLIATAVGYLATAFEWFWNNVASPVWTAIRYLIGLVGAFIVNTIDRIVTVFKTIGQVATWLWSNVFSPVFSAIAAVVGVVVAVFMWFWNTFSPLFIAIGKLVWAIFSGVIIVAFNILKVAFYALAAVVMAFVALFVAAWKFLAPIVMNVYNTYIKPYIDMFALAISLLWTTYVQPALSSIAGFFTWLGGVVSIVVASITVFFNNLGNTITSIWSNIVTVVKAAAASISATASTFSSFVNGVVGYFTGLVNGARERINNLVNAFSGVSGQISGFFSSAGTWLYEAGKSIVQGLINGIGSMIGSLQSRMSEIAGSVRDYLPFSPAKVGPLSGSGSPERSGSKIIGMIADGMSEMLPTLELVSSNAVGSIQAGLTANPIQALSPAMVGPVLSPARAGGAAGGAGAVGNAYYLTVNSLDPRSAADGVMAAIGSWEKSNGRGWRS